METTDLVPLIEQLDDNIDDLEESLVPLLKTALHKTAGTLPLLDKAQLYVLVSYAIESIIFSFLRLSGIDAKEHPVFRELTRVKQYFEKIKVAESVGTTPNTKLDKAAAGRFIKHALAGNKRHDIDQAKNQATKKAATHIRFEESSSSPTNVAALDTKSRSDDLKGGLETNHLSPVKPGRPGSSTASGKESLDDDTIEAKTKASQKRKHMTDNSNVERPLENESKHEKKKRKKLLKKLKGLEGSEVGQSDR